MDLWTTLNPIAAPAASDRTMFATAANAGGFSERGSLVWKDASGNYRCSGRLGIGAGVTPIADLTVRGAGSSIGFNAGAISSPSKGNLYYESDGTGWRFEIGLYQASAFFPQLIFQDNGVVRPGGSGTQNFASASFPWNNSYFVVSPTVTSDGTKKQLRGDGAATEAERAWARAIVPVCYQMLDAIADKGDDARLHWGAVAQQVYQAGIDAGIADPFRHGFVGRDPRLKNETRTKTILRQKTRMVTAEASEIEIRDGRAVLVKKMISRPEPVFTEMPVVDEAGTLMMIDEPVIGEDGAPVMVDGPSGRVVQMQRVPLIHREPEMEEVEVEEIIEVPSLDGAGEPEYDWSLRYIELFMFMWACGAFGGLE